MGDAKELQESSLPQPLHGFLIKQPLEDPAIAIRQRETRSVQNTLSYLLISPALLGENRRRTSGVYSGAKAGPSDAFNTSYYSAAAQPLIRLPAINQGFGPPVDDDPVSHTVNYSTSRGSDLRAQLPMPGRAGRSQSAQGWQTEPERPAVPMRRSIPPPPPPQMSLPPEGYTGTSGNPSVTEFSPWRTPESRRWNSEKDAHHGSGQISLSPEGLFIKRHASPTISASSRKVAELDRGDREGGTYHGSALSAQRISQIISSPPGPPEFPPSIKDVGHINRIDGPDFASQAAAPAGTWGS